MGVWVLDSTNVYRVLPLSEIPWLEHGFGTRFSEDWPDQERLVMLRQIHSNRVVRVGGALKAGRIGEGDALITNQPGILIGVRTADCVPILLVDVARRAVAAVHAGWRGVVGEVAIRTVEALQREYGSQPSELRAAIGPAIGQCCYEVGPEVASRLRPWFPERDDLERRTHVDLGEANRRQLMAVGLLAERIISGAPCTFCTPGLYSYRREGGYGRMISAIGVRE